MKTAAGEQKEEDIAMAAGNVQRLVTADGTYATQSAFSTQKANKKDQDRYQYKKD